MTDLQVKYQTLQLEKEKLAEEKRLHDSQILKNRVEATTSAYQGQKFRRETDKLIQEVERLELEIEYYEANTYASWIQGAYSSTGNLLKGISGFLPKKG